MEVLFSCEDCGLVRVPVIVRERYRNEGVIQYIQAEVMRAVGLTHLILSPVCFARVMSEVLIPTNEQGVGFEEKEERWGLA